MSWPATASSLDDDGAHTSVVTGAEKSGGSLTGPAERRVWAERRLMLMLVVVVVEEPVAVAIHCPSGLPTQVEDATQCCQMVKRGAVLANRRM